MPVVINRDGTLNIHRPREFNKFFSDLYHYFLAIAWPKFFTILVAIFLVFNALFGFLYFSMGPGALSGIHQDSELNRLIDCFFFSVKSLDGVSPIGLWPNMLAMIESYLGMLTLVIVTGLLYARFARPKARVIFSDNAIINTYNHKPCIVFRVANERLNQIVEARMIVTLTKMETSQEGETSRKLFNKIGKRLFAGLRVKLDNTPLY